MYDLLFKFLVTIVALDVFLVGVLLILLINARTSLRRNIHDQRYNMKIFTAAKSSKTSEEAAKGAGINLDEFKKFCSKKHIELPEDRIERVTLQKKHEQEEQERILEEEATWRAEQERQAEERRAAKEDEARQRHERLRRFGFTK